MNKNPRTIEENHTLASVGVLIDSIHKDYQSTISRIGKLTSHGEITFDLLYAIMVPRTLLVTTCPYTGEPRALRLVSFSRSCPFYYDLTCESIDAADDENKKQQHPGETTQSTPDASQPYGTVTTRVVIPFFNSSVKINTLDAYPIKYHRDEEELRRTLLARGRKWVSLRGTHHMQYHGTAVVSSIGLGGRPQVVKYNVCYLALSLVLLLIGE